MHIHIHAQPFWSQGTQVLQCFKCISMIKFMAIYLSEHFCLPAQQQSRLLKPLSCGVCQKSHTHLKAHASPITTSTKMVRHPYRCCWGDRLLSRSQRPSNMATSAFLLHLNSPLAQWTTLFWLDRMSNTKGTTIAVLLWLGEKHTFWLSGQQMHSILGGAVSSSCTGSFAHNIHQCFQS